MSKNIVELVANGEVTPDKSWEGTFPAMHVAELMLEFDPKHLGPPVSVLHTDTGTTKEVHLLPLRGREGRYSLQIGGTENYVKIAVRLAARGKKARLLKVKLLGKPPGA